MAQSETRGIGASAVSESAGAPACFEGTRPCVTCAGGQCLDELADPSFAPGETPAIGQELPTQAVRMSASALPAADASVGGRAPTCGEEPIMDHTQRISLLKLGALVVPALAWIVANIVTGGYWL